MIRHHTRPIFAALGTILTAGVGLASCGSSNSAAKVEVPPSGATAIEAWLTAGSYKEWKCETAVHASRNPSPHGFNRICSNSAISNTTGGTGEWPVDSAAVKELYAAIDAPTPVGYAVYRKTNANSAGGTNWYWYERVPLDHPAPHDAAGVVADGMGSSGPAMTICVGCHIAAGTDAAHTPSVGGRDQVYTPVR